MLHPAQAHRARRLSLPRLLPLVLILLAFGLGLPAASWACADPPPPTSVWVIIDGDSVWIIIRGFSLFPVPANGYCGCGIRLPDSLATIRGADLFNMATQQIEPGFSFDQNDTTAASFEGGGYQGFRTITSLAGRSAQPAQFGSDFTEL